MELSIEVKSYLVIAVMVGCFAMVYPSFMHPILLRLFGFNKPVKSDRDEFMNNRPHMNDRGSSRTESSPTTSSSGVMGVVLPVYALGIVMYLAYTLAKVVTGKKSNKGKSSREDYLREYYRNFHYDPKKGRFSMGRGSSDEDSDESQHEFDSMDSYKRKNQKGSFNWAAAYGDADSSHLYRSQNSLPKDLAYLLKKVDNENLTEDELVRLKIRLEQTEEEMNRILQAMQSMSEAYQTKADEQENYTEDVKVENKTHEKEEILNISSENQEIEEIRKRDKNKSNMSNSNLQATEDTNKQNSKTGTNNKRVRNKKKKN